jgi:tetratricopeptide (TPR) repeat protein
LLKKSLWLIILLSICTLCVSSGMSFAEDKATDALDRTLYQNQVKEYGIPTKESVEQLSVKAAQLFDTKDYKNALPALQEFEKQSNWLANLISTGLKPYYSASYDDRKSFPYNKSRNLIAYEKLSNDLKSRRNHAMVLEAECLVYLGNFKDAVSVYLKSLDLIDIEDWDWWTRAQQGLYKLIGV